MDSDFSKFLLLFLEWSVELDSSQLFTYFFSEMPWKAFQYFEGGKLGMAVKE